MAFRKKALAGATALLVGGALIAAPTAAQAAEHPSGVAINEINSQGDDFVELINTGDDAVDISDWTFTDDKTDRDSDRGRFEPGTVIEPGELLLLWGEGHAEEAFGFGLGGGDAVNLFDGTGEIVDAHEYPSHAGDGLTWSRVPDGTGEFVTAPATPGAFNAAEQEPEEPSEPAEPEVESPIVINEVESNGDPVDDWVELANTDLENSIDLSGWWILDGDPSHAPLVFPEGTVIESGGYWSIYTDAEQGDAGFGLGGNDSVTLFNAEGQVVDFTEWSGHAATTWGRIPDMTGGFAVTGEPTRNLPNVEAAEAEPVNSTPWPWALDEIVAAENGVFDGDISGVDFDENGRAYVVHNGEGQLFVLEFAGTDAQIVSSYQLRYEDGEGIPDAEGVTVGADGVVYLATERNNADNGVSRPSVLRFDLPAAGNDLVELPAAAEWNLTDSTGVLGANSGLEAVEWLPNAFGGSYAMGVEGTGEVLFVTLNADGSHELIERYKSPFQGVMALDYDERFNELLVMCDEVCDGRSVLLTLEDDTIVEASNEQGVLLIDRPELLPNTANEGFASYVTIEACPADANGNAQDGFVQTVRQLWGDDNALDGTSLRTGITVIEECGPGAGEPTDPTNPTDPTDPADPAEDPTDGSRSELPETAAAPAAWLLVVAALMAAAGIAAVGVRRGA